MPSLKPTSFSWPAIASNSLISSRLHLWIAFSLIWIVSNPGNTLIGQDQEPFIRGINNSLGFREHRAGLWSYLSPEITNPSDQAVDVEVVLFFASAQNKQFAKRVTVPARSTLRTSVPVFIPKDASRGIDAQVHLYDVSGDKPVLLINDRKRSYDTAISIRDSSFGESGSKYRASAMFQSALNIRSTDQDDAAELVSAARIYFNHNSRVGTSTTMYLPESARAFESVDQLVIHNDHLLHDSAGLESVRRWLARGGNLWIMLDLVSEETVRRIMGDSIPFQVIDRTSLNTFRIKDADQYSVLTEPVPMVFEKPVKFTRVVLSEGNLMHSHDGWPVSFWMKSNLGKVFFTTAGARTLMRLRERGSAQPNIRLGITKYTVTDPMEDLGYQMYVEKKPDPIFDSEVMKTELVNQIGYQVLSRSSVLIVLSTYTLLLFVLGIWFASMKKLERLFYVGPLLALMAAAIFYGLGQANQKSAPPTVASFQFVQPIDGGDELQVDGTTVVYSHEKKEFELSADNDGQVVSSSESKKEEPGKTVWESNGSWRMDRGEIAPGLEAYQVTSNVKTNQRISIVGRFTESGLTGTFTRSNSDAKVEDILLALPQGKFAAIDLNNTKYTIDSHNQLPSGQFVQTSLFSDIQRWRQSVYQNQFPDDPDRWEKSPTVYFWTDPLDLDVRFPDDFRRVGGALHRVPMKLVKSPSGTRVRIPSSFITSENVMNSRNVLSPNFQTKTGKWVGSIAKETTTRVRFQLPPQVLPLELSRVRLSIDLVKCLDRVVEILPVNGDKSNEIGRMENFVGKFEKELTDPNVLVLDEKGGFLIDVNVKVNPEFYERKEKFEFTGELNADGTKERHLNSNGTHKKMELSRDDFAGIELFVTGTVK